MKYLRMFAFGAMLLPLVSGCSSDDSKTAVSASLPPVVKGVVKEVVKSVSLPELTTVTGTVRAGTSSLVSARIQGSIETVSAREGDRVAKGAILMKIFAQESVSGSLAASAGTEEAKRGVDDASARVRLAESTLKRFQNLFNEQAVTKQELEVREMEAEVARQSLSRAQARLKQAAEGEKGASAVAGHTKVTSPISGIIVQKHADLGSTVFPGSPLYTIEAEGSYRLELNFPESLAGKVRVGEYLDITIDGLQAKQKSRIMEIVPQIDPATRTFIVKCEVKGKSIRSGLFGKGAFVSGSANGIILPKKAIITRGALTSVWVINNGSAALRIIRTGREIGDRVEIISGLTDGETVVTGGTFPAVEGSKVE